MPFSPRVAHGGDLALDAAHSEPPGHQHGVEPIQIGGREKPLDLVAGYPAEIERHVGGERPVAQ